MFCFKCVLVYTGIQCVMSTGTYGDVTDHEWTNHEWTDHAV